METEILSGLLGVAGTIIVALAGLSAALLRRNGNKRPVNPGDPDQARLGDCSVRWWKEQMDAYFGEVVGAIRESKS